MKKIIMMLTAVLSLGMASLGFASPASDLLAQEETTTTKVIGLIQGKGQLAEVSTGFTPALQKNFNAAALENIKKVVLLMRRKPRWECMFSKKKSLA